MGRKEASASMEIRSGKASYGIMVYGDCFIARVRCDSCNREVLCMDGNVAGYDPTDAAIQQWLAYAQNRNDTELIILLKTVRLAGLGRLGMRPEKATLVPEDKAQNGDIPLLIDRHDSDAPERIYYLHTTYDKKRFYGIHLWCYMQTNVRLQ